MSKIPIKNELGFFEVRMESLGGMGANLAAKLLCEAAIIGMGMNGASFASYGSEKTGSPVKAFVRISEPDIPLRTSSPVEEPHLLVIFHENLVNALPVTAGLKANAKVVLNTEKQVDEARDFLRLWSGELFCIDALNIAIEEKVRINTPILGATARASGFIEPTALKKAIEETFSKRYPHLVKANLKAFDRGFEEVRSKKFEIDGKYPEVPYTYPLPRLGYNNAPIGATITNVGNTEEKDLSASREGFIPLWYPEKCKHCGECDVICGDFCFVWKQGKDTKGRPRMLLKGIQYRYCKGCMRCVEICKFGALEAIKESEVNLKELPFNI
jgi:pyruvate ferredoxin oxidoreductase gamma subunit